MQTPLNYISAPYNFLSSIEHSPFHLETFEIVSKHGREIAIRKRRNILENYEDNTNTYLSLRVYFKLLENTEEIFLKKNYNK